jgi:hypothetical protein
LWRHDTVAARGSIVARALSAHVVTVRAWSLDTAPSLTGSEFGQVRSFDESTEAVRRALVADTRVMLEHFPEVPVEYHVFTDVRREAWSRSPGTHVLSSRAP